MRNSLILTSSSENFHLAAVPLPGDSLSGEQSPTARCEGLNCVKNTCNSRKHFAVLIDSSLTLPEIHP